MFACCHVSFPQCQPVFPYLPAPNAQPCFWWHHSPFCDGMLPPRVDGAPQDLRCAVCTDRAEGFHFGCLSCAACGAFFRRSVSDQKVYHCVSRECSVIYDPSKKGGCCRYCRFTRCLAVGMLPHEVRAKRSSSVACTPISGAVRERARVLASQQPQPGGNPDDTVVERILHLRRELRNEPMMPMARERTIFSNFRRALQEEFEMFRNLTNQHSLIRELIFENDSDSITCTHWCDLEPPVREIFLMFFLHETLFCTARGGGIQLDRLILPNRSFVELNEYYISLFFLEDPTVTEPATLARLCYPPFSTLVQSSARIIQSAHLDETDSAILFYISLSQSVAPMQRLPAAERSRHAMFTELANSLEAVGVDFSVKVGNVLFLVEPLLNAVTAMHEIISFVYVAGTTWRDASVSVKDEAEWLCDVRPLLSSHSLSASQPALSPLARPRSDALDAQLHAMQLFLPLSCLLCCPPFTRKLY